MSDTSGDRPRTSTLEQYTLDVDLANLAAFKSEDPAAIMRLYGEYLSALFVFIKSGIVFELNNPTLHQACDRLAKVANFVFQNLEGSASVHLLNDGVYVNRNLLKVRGSRFEQGEYLTLILHAIGIGSISLNNCVEREDWLEFMKEFHGVVRGESVHGDMSKLKLPNIEISPPENPESDDNEVTVTDRFRTLRGYCVAVITMRQTVKQLQGKRELRLVMLKRSLLELASVSEECPDILVALINLKRHKADLGHHLVNTAVLCMVMAQELGLNRKHTLELVMQAALHDVGKCMLPEDHNADVVQVERRRAQETVSHVARTLAMFTRTSMRVAVANETRMWVDGKNRVNEDYPFELAAPSKLVAVAHAYDMLTSPSKHRQSLLPDEALQVIYSEAGKRYDEGAARILVNALGVFPVGSVVKLSSGQTAIVVESPREGDPTRPRVKVIRDTRGKPIDGGVIDLAKKASIKVAQCVDAEEKEINIPAFLLG